MKQAIEQLVDCGLSRQAALAKAEMLGRCVQALGGRQPDMAFYVPGRIEVLGKHTDYAGGRSITCATDRGFVFAAKVSPKPNMLVQALDAKQSAGFDLSSDLRIVDRGWENYVMTLARRVARNFGPSLRGAEIAFSSDLPPAAGMSSSSALLVGVFLVLSAANNLPDRPEYTREIRTMEDLAGYLGCCENGQSFGSLKGDRGVGTFGGSEDHTAILCSKPGLLSVCTYSPVRLERQIEFPPEMALAIGSSGVIAEKTAAARAKYNRVSLTMQAVMEVLRQAGWDKPTMASAIGDDRAAAECVRRTIAGSSHQQFRPAELLLRFDQFACEHQHIIPTFGDALKTRDVVQLSAVVGQSQKLAETHLGNQVPQTVGLVELARKSGAIAASAFGAGFGGSVWAIAPRPQAEQFLAAWRQSYHARFPAHAEKSTFFLTEPSGGATRII